MRRKYDVATLTQYRYPNLVAEFMETGYSICTLSEHMGHGRRQENDPEINSKLFGSEDIFASEAFGLARLFGCKVEYLFSNELEMFGDMPIAYIRHYDSNKRQERELEVFRTSEEIRRTLAEKPYLLEFMKEALTWTSEQVQQVTEMLQDLKSA